MVVEDMNIDLNCDMGESFGAYAMGYDEAIMPHVTSANIACGFHAGDPQVMGKTVKLALTHGVALGAHPGLPDLMGFGRRKMDVSPGEMRDYVRYQIGALREYARAAGKSLQHLKPHGVLYHMMNMEDELAAAMAEMAIESDLILIAHSSSRYAQVATSKGARVATEACADRGYNADGTLVSRKAKGALITDPALAAAQAVRMVREGKVRAIDGSEFSVSVQSVACHADTDGADEIAAAVRTALEQAGCIVKPLGEWFR